METQKIWNNFSGELYFFILKKVKNKDVTNDIFQNTFLKIHKNISQLQKEEKVKAWIFQIARNEIVNHFNTEAVYVEKMIINKQNPPQEYEHICCFDKFITDLPEIHRQVIELIYVKGLKQKEVAKELEISLENVKVRVKRAKDILKKKFNECCNYGIDKNGKLIGESSCPICKTY